MTELPEWLKTIEKEGEGTFLTVIESRLLSTLKAVWEGTQGNYEWNASLNRFTGNIRRIIERGGEEKG